MSQSRKRGPTLNLRAIINEIRSNGNPDSLAGMASYGIQTGNAFGVSVTRLRAIGKKLGRDHRMALRLWKTGIHEARILAGIIDDPAQVTEEQMEDWATDFDSWDVVDGSCGNLFDKTPFAAKKAIEWSDRKGEFVKRAGFVLMAELAVHSKKLGNATFLEFLPLMVREASDERNFVKKAVNWGLRQIGKRNAILNGAAIRACDKIQKIDSRSARWIASDALRELTSAPVQKKFKDAKQNS